jgi:CP family cyanate transporter-like MFS transporter
MPPHSVLLGAVFGLQSICFAAVTNWIAALYHHHGWTSGHAAFTTAMVSILVIPGALVIPALSDRGDRRTWVLGSALTMAAGIAGFAFAPLALPWVWITAFGIGNGAMFPLCLTLPQDMAQSEGARTELTAWMLGIGYVLSATGPLLVGGLLDLTGSYEVPMALLAAIGTTSGMLAMNPALKRRPPGVVSLGGLTGYAE